MKKKAIVIGIGVLALAAFLGWRFVRPLNIFVVSKSFERPVDTQKIPEPLHTLRAQECGACHQAFYREWRTTIHSQAWTDPYFQADWTFEGKEPVCKNCHIPLDRQQAHRVIGFRDRDKWEPILKPNPAFDPVLQHQGVTCAACHLRDGKILGPYGDVQAPHPVQKLKNTNEICVRCHVVQGNRWDTFYKFPPCGTAAEIAAGHGQRHGRSGEYVVRSVAELGCVQCHMPVVQRALVEGGKVRQARRHLWRGGHDPAMVKQGLDVQLKEQQGASKSTRTFVLTLTNVGAAHYLPTGTPDRYLSVEWRLRDAKGALLRKHTETLRRTVMWRPFIVDLWDTRLPYGKPRTYRFSVSTQGSPRPATLEVVVRYHLLDESRRKRIGYRNAQPIAYAVFQRTVPLSGDRADLSAHDRAVTTPSSRVMR